MKEPQCLSSSYSEKYWSLSQIHFRWGTPAHTEFDEVMMNLAENLSSIWWRVKVGVDRLNARAKILQER